MRISLRFIVPLGLALAAIAYAVVPLVDRLTLQWFVRDLEIRAPADRQRGAGAARRAGARAARAPEGAALFRPHRPGRAHLRLGFCDPRGKLAYATRHLPARAVQLPRPRKAAAANAGCCSWRDGPLHVSVNPVARMARRSARW